MKEIKEQNCDSNDYEISKDGKKVRIGITVIGFDNCEERDKFFEETRKYKENIKSILAGE